MAEPRYTIMLAEKRQDPRQCHARHSTRNTLAISNLRLTKGRPAVVAQWWFLKNRALLKKHLDNGRIVIKAPDGSTMGSSPVAQVSPPQPVVPEVKPVVSEPVVEEPAPVVAVVLDDFNLLPLREPKIKRLQEVAKTFSDLVAMGLEGLMEVGLTTSQAEKTLEFAKGKVG